jgi:hypothetical protein
VSGQSFIAGGVRLTCVHVRGLFVVSSSDPTLGMDFGSEQYPTEKLLGEKKHFSEKNCFFFIFWGFCFRGLLNFFKKN